MYTGGVATMSEWLWLLLPIAATSGWLAASTRYGKDRSDKPDIDIPPEYLRGVGFLLDQQHDKATEIFIKLFEADPNTVETHLVLGNLFRQKGEVEKAIRIHQNIIARPRLSNYHRTTALLELGRDYFSAGLLDRAEKFFNHVLSMKVEQVKVEAYSYLVSLYETEKSWERAIDAAGKLRKRNIGGYSDRISHYYCELAEQAIRQRNYAHARKLLSKVKARSNAAMRAGVLSGDIDLACGQTTAAEQHYTEAFRERPEYARFLLPKINKTMLRLSAPELADYLKDLKPEIISISYLLAYCQSLLDAGRIDEVRQLFSELAEKDRVPLSVVRLYLEYKAQDSVADKRLISDIIQLLAANEYADQLYQCSNCGFEMHQLYWQCPSCHRWGTAQSQDVIDTRPDSGKDSAEGRQMFAA